MTSEKVTEKMMWMEKLRVGLFLTVCGYCMGRQLCLLYFACVEHKKLRRETDNAYMNMITNIEEQDMVREESMA
jgi:hypothetical protein